MPLIPFPCLNDQRKLLNIPRGSERFEAYLQIITEGTDECRSPLVRFNPMSKEHVRIRLDELIALDADRILVQSIEEIDLEYKPNGKIGLVVADDVAGGWTCRETIELDSLTAHNRGSNQEWLSVLWWASDEPTADLVKKSIRAQIFKIVFVSQRPIKSLGELIELEKLTLIFSDDFTPGDASEWAGRFRNFLSATDFPTMLACFYGDQSAEKLGYSKHGFPKHAGKIYARSLIEKRLK